MARLTAPRFTSAKARRREALVLAMVGQLAETGEIRRGDLIKAGFTAAEVDTLGEACVAEATWRRTQAHAEPQP